MDSRKLRRLTEMADHQHRVGMADVHRSFEIAHLDTTDEVRVASRRNFLRRAGATTVAIGAVSVPLGAMASAAWAQTADEPMMSGDMMGGGNGGANGPSCDSDPVAMPASEEQVVVFAESVERAAVAAYSLARDRKLLSTAASESARLFEGHHADHAEALRCLLGGPVQDPNPALVAALAPQIDAVRDEAGLIQLLVGIEQGAAATYFAVLGDLTTIEVAGAAATILPVEAQHEVVWSQYLDLPITQYVPTLQTTQGAFAPA